MEQLLIEVTRLNCNATTWQMNRWGINCSPDSMVFVIYFISLKTDGLLLVIVLYIKYFINLVFQEICCR